eukprot:935707-Amphidinium_carterae.1
MASACYTGMSFVHRLLQPLELDAPAHIRIGFDQSLLRTIPCQGNTIVRVQVLTHRSLTCARRDFNAWPFANER